MLGKLDAKTFLRVAKRHRFDPQFSLQCIAKRRNASMSVARTTRAPHSFTTQILAILSRHLAGFRRRLARGAWLFPRCCGSFSRFGYRFNRRWQFQLGLFRSPIVAVVQQLDARSFFFYPQLSVSTFLSLVLKICRNRLSCHNQSVAELAPSELSNFGHSVTIQGPSRRGGGLGRFVSLYPTREPERRNQETHTRASRPVSGLLLLFFQTALRRPLSKLMTRNQPHNQQQVDQASADMQTETYKPQNHKNHENGPNHVKPPALICEHLNSET